MTLRICAVVVTYNRARLLEECVQALLGQSVSLDIHVVDNASTDDTPSVLAALTAQPGVTVHRLESNLGGAGGFEQGLRDAYSRDTYDGFWLLDDDTIPEANCLQELLEAQERLRRHGSEPAFLASRVVWTDGRRHPMNSGMLSGEHERLEQAASAGCVALRAASFVSVLIPRAQVSRHGFPIPEFFIWGDDVEYTLRLSQHALGVLVPPSCATHKTTYFELGSPGARFYYRVRNTLWLLRLSPSLRAERAVWSMRLIRSVGKVTLEHPTSEILLATARGLRDGLLRAPVHRVRPAPRPAPSAPDQH